MLRVVVTTYWPVAVAHRTMVTLEEVHEFGLRLDVEKHDDALLGEMTRVTAETYRTGVDTVRVVELITEALNFVGTSPQGGGVFSAAQLESVVVG